MPEHTKVARIPLNPPPNDLEAEIVNVGNNQLFAGFALASTFVFGTDLILVFQRP